MIAVDETATMPAAPAEEHVTEIERARAKWLANAHRLLDFLGARPDLPLPWYFAVEVPVSAFLDPVAARHAVGAAAELLGVEPAPKHGRFSAGVAFGSAHYHVYSMAPADLARSAEIRRLGVAAFEEQAGAPVPESTAAEMAPAPRVLPVASNPDAVDVPEAAEETALPATTTPAGSPARKGPSRGPKGRAASGVSR